MKALVVFISIWVCAFAINAQAPNLYVDGIVKEGKDKLDGVKVSIKMGRAMVNELTTSKNGKFEFEINFGGLYMMYFEKPGYVTKMISIDTKGVPAEEAEYGFEYSGWVVELFQEMEGLDVSILQQPIGKIIYDTETEGFSHDAAYTQTVQQKLQELQEELERRLADEAAAGAKKQQYNAAIKQADALLASNSLAEAKKGYENAAKLMPAEKYPATKIGEIDKMMGQKAQYDDMIASAGKKFTSKDYQGALADFKSAAGLMPSESLPKQKIKEIQDIIDAQAKEAEANKQKEEQYNKLISSADGKMSSKDYNGAKADYQAALGVKPGEKYPKDKIAEADKFIADLAKAEADAKAKEEQYKGFISSADSKFKAKDYEGAKKDYLSASGVKPEEKYPKDKIAEADKILGDLAKSEADAKAKEEKYNGFIASADKKMKAQDLQGAKSDYSSASTVKPDEAYPKDKIAEIDKALADKEKLEADAKAKDEKYQAKIKEGDTKMGAQDYDGAKAAFQAASGIKPDESYPKDKLKAIDQYLADKAKREQDEKAKQAEYDGLMASASQKETVDDFPGAISDYEKALGLKPGEELPKKKIDELKNKIEVKKEQEAANKEKEEQYNSAIASADKKFKAKDYEGAKTDYKSASGVKPQEAYPKDQLAQIDQILGDLAKSAADAKAQEEKYQGLITSADSKFGKKDYEGAKGDYQSALTVKISEKYPKDKIAEIDKILSDKAKSEAEAAAKEEKYNQHISAGDSKMGAKDYTGARKEYSAALVVKPSEKYPTDKISEIDGLIGDLAAKEAEAKAKEDQYNNAISSGDKKFKSNDYEGAKVEYQSAISVKPNEVYPKDQISKIDQILADLAKSAADSQAKEEQYNKLISSADSKLSSKDYSGAKADYQSALNLKPGEKYPKDKIAEVDKMLGDLAKSEADAKAKEEEYKKLIASGDSKMSSKDYTGARKDFSSALGIKPGESYPTSKISDIDKLIGDQAAKEAEAKAKEEQYKSLIAAADSKFKSKDYQGAKGDYISAGKIKSGETYPGEQVAKIEEILKSLANQEADAAAKEKQYQDLLASADSKLSSKNYNGAKGDYQSALGMKPGEKYPKDKIAEIDKLLEGIAAAANAKDKDYMDKIKSADQKFANKDYKGAKTDYQAASTMKSGESYPKEKIQERDGILAQLASAQASAKEIEEKYKAFVKSADQKLASKDYNGAKSEYQNALGVKPNEQYPADKISEIQSILVRLDQERLADEAAKQSELDKQATEQERIKKYNSLISLADQAFGNKEYADAQKGYEAALRVKADPYPSQQIEKIRQIAEAQMAEEKRNDDLERKYREAVSQADYLFKTHKYEPAKNAYVNASGIKPNEKYPKDKIAEVQAILDKIEQAKANASNNTTQITEVVDPQKDIQKWRDELARKYPQGVTEEIITEGSKTITRRIVVTGPHGHEYKMILHRWGGKFFFKDGTPITELIWNHETVLN